MITVALSGRTGNNLFQYAVGRALSLRRNTSLVLDGSWVNATQARSFQDLLPLRLAAAYRDSGRLTKRILRTARINPARLHKGTVYEEQSHAFDPSVLDLPDGTLLRGAFQNYRYFEEIKEVLRRDLDLRQLQIPRDSMDFERLLDSCNAISIHVRRGDYLHIDCTQCLTPGYHERAIDWFRQRYSNSTFCVFSDDIPWCRTRFQGSDFLFCDLPASHQSPLHDLRLMAACKHHVIVNSSYSWWGAWLNATPNRIVIAPLMWMTGLSSTSLLLPDWIVM